MVIVMIINLYAVRIVLRALGTDDYGIYQVVAGIVISFQSFSAVISTSTLRFYSYSIGQKSLTQLSEIFSASINIYACVSLVCLILGETVGVWFVNSELNIPPERIYASNWVFQFALLALIFTILHSPFSGIIIAHENMGYFAVISLGESLLKLLAIILISQTDGDKLILYALSLLIVPIISLIAYIWKTRKQFPGIRYSKVERKSWYREMLSFSGWHLFSAGASVGINQVNTVLTNLFFPLIVNAARGVALQVQGAFSSFTSSFITAVRPPIIKAYAEGNYPYLNVLFSYANKFIYYLSILVAIPLYIKMETILVLWLGECNYDMILFSRLIIIYSVILALNNPISIIIQATGKIRQYFVPVECVTLLCPILTYILFKLGFAPQSSFYAMIVTIACAHIVRIYCLKKIYTEFELKKYIIGFLIPALIITAISYLSQSILVSFFNITIVLFFIISFIISGGIIVLFGLNKLERHKLIHMFNQHIRSN